MRVLITGMSGVGKTTIIGALRALGFRAIDMGLSVKDRGSQNGSTAEAVVGGPATHLQFKNPLAERDRIFGNSPHQTEHIGVHPTTPRRNSDAIRDERDRG
jgi:dephospho-CoA kinase